MQLSYSPDILNIFKTKIVIILNLLITLSVFIYSNNGTGWICFRAVYSNSPKFNSDWFSFFINTYRTHICGYVDSEYGTFGL